jgi:NTP pyrophosphatase (non-canonical NTP hydrolase)
MELEALTRRALDVRRRYAELEQTRSGRAWTREEIALGFMGDVGDLAKLVMAQAGLRPIPQADQKLAHELADCLWSILVLAQMYGVDLEQAFLKTMDELEQSIVAQGQAPSSEQRI